jgi:uroporphyrinogen decarboxylase
MKQETLTSRERVIRTLNRESVDRFPIDLGSHPSTGISAFAYWNLRKYLGLSVDDIWIPDCVQLLAYIDEDIRTRFHLDCILLEPRWETTMRWQPREKYQFHIPAAMNPYQSGYGDWLVRRGPDEMRMPGGGYFFDGAWLHDWGTGNEDADLALYAREAERIYKETSYATNFVGYGHGEGFGAFFGNIDRLVRMLDDPDAVIQENEARCEEYIRRAGKIIDFMGEYIQLLSINDDMGMQHGPMCKPSIVEQCVAPFIKKFCEFIHRNSDIKVFMHNCGSIKPLIPILIDCGVDVLNPVQISAADMEPQDLKQEFGDNIIFWGGGCDTQNILGTATPEMVAENVRELIRIFKSGGGFVFTQVHNIMGDVPPENIVAMLDTAYEESFYEHLS